MQEPASLPADQFDDVLRRLQCLGMVADGVEGEGQQIECHEQSSEVLLAVTVAHPPALVGERRAALAQAADQGFEVLHPDVESHLG